MFKPTFEKVAQQFTKMIKDLDAVIEANQGEVETYDQMIASMEAKKEVCASEVEKSTKLKSKIADLLA